MHHRSVKLWVAVLFLLLDFLLLLKNASHVGVLRHHGGGDEDDNLVGSPLPEAEPRVVSTTSTTGRKHISIASIHAHHAFSTRQQDEAAILDGLPPWVLNYFAWHRRMRNKFPDDQLFKNKTAPKLLVQVCIKTKKSGVCGGLHDRLGRLSTFLFVASQTNRLLLIHWYDPVPLQHFLQPNLLNWTLPHDNARFSRSNILQKNAFHAPTSSATLMEWATDPIQKFKRLLVFGRVKVSTETMVTALKAANETDMLDDTVSFGKIWHAFFRPSRKLQVRLQETTTSRGLQAGHYVATHCRVRHPGRFAVETLGRNGSTADATGLSFEGDNRAMAVESALHALKCTRTLLLSNSTTAESVYFYSDSEDLVQYMSRDTRNGSNGGSNETAALDRQAAKLLSHTRVVSQDVSDYAIAHLDRQLGLPADAYMATFVDLYVAMAARCIVFGVGNFAHLAAKISGTKCMLIHEEPYSKHKAKKWNQQTGGAPLCLL